MDREQCLIVTDGKERRWFERQKNGFRSNVSGLDPALDAAALALPVIGGHEKFSPVLRTLAAMRTYSINPTKVREMQDPDSGAALRFDGATRQASCSKRLYRQGDTERICEILSAIVPNTVGVRPIKHGKRVVTGIYAEMEREKTASV